MSDPNLRFLIVDDDIEIRALMCENLRSFGFKHIWEVGRVKDALDVINSQPLDCIISDWNLPGASGFTLLRLIKSQAAFRAVIFIMLSAIEFHEEDKVNRALMMRMDGFLLKPFRAAQLKELLDRVLEGRGSIA